MYRIIKIGMDVHSKNYTLCAMEPVIGEEDRIFANIQVTADYKNILMFIEELKFKLGLALDNEYDIVVCGYEAGCLGYSLYNQLTSAGVKCVILAPTTMLTPQGLEKQPPVSSSPKCWKHSGNHAEKDNRWCGTYLSCRRGNRFPETDTGSDSFGAEPVSSGSLFFCLPFSFLQKKRTAMKALRYDSNGFLLASKSLLDDQKFLWPKSKEEIRDITSTQFEWLLQGIEIDQKHTLHSVDISPENTCF